MKLRKELQPKKRTKKECGGCGMPTSQFFLNCVQDSSLKDVSKEVGISSNREKKFKSM